MKKLFSAIAMIALSSTGATAEDWNGSYAGAAISYNNTDLTITEPFSGSISQDANRLSLTAFGGHNWQKGAFVYGVEGRLTSHGEREEMTSVPGPGAFESGLGTHGALLLRAGYDAGNYMPFVTFGVAAARLNTYYPGGDVHRNGTIAGPMVGVGADAKLGENLFLRGSVDASFYNGKTFEYCGFGCILEHDTRNISASIGVGYKF